MTRPYRDTTAETMAVFFAVFVIVLATIYGVVIVLDLLGWLP